MWIYHVEMIVSIKLNEQKKPSTPYNSNSKTNIPRHLFVYFFLNFIVFTWLVTKSMGKIPKFLFNLAVFFIYFFFNRFYFYFYSLNVLDFFFFFFYFKIIPNSKSTKKCTLCGCADVVSLRIEIK